MAEKVTTGGIKTFIYKKNHNPRFDKEQREEIRKAYEQVNERKHLEKKRKRRLVIITIILVIIAIVISFMFLK